VLQWVFQCTVVCLFGRNCVFNDQMLEVCCSVDCSVLQCVAVCVAVCCSVLQCVAV